MTRVLVARLDSAGDVLLAGPAVRAIAAGRGEEPGPNEVLMLCGPQGAAAARLLPHVDRVLVWAAPWIVDPAPEVSEEHLARLREMVEGAGVEEAVILTSFHQSPLPLALLLRLAGVRRICGASTDYAGSLLDTRLRPGEDFPEDQPEAERALAIARAAGYDLPAGDDGRLRVREVPDVSALVGEGPYVVVHPGAAVPARAWPPLHHAAAVELLTAAGHRVVVTGGPQERELTATVAGAAGLDLGGRTDLHGLAGVLAGASVVVSGNTGPAHLAAAVGTPVVSLFAPVVPAIRWAPYKVPLELLGDQNAPCRLSRARVCPVPGHPCLAAVQPEDVAAAVERLAADVPSLGTRRQLGRAPKPTPERWYQ
ncbi:glycosyltransferase family 9 protein [Arthrobacter mobilis]|uniref:Glycosyltransferase family 9 protein n=1 Tax=Arthrobacter mobilis TaxID=2724944 RepID=A0A7X6HDH0_9MICC|nr:glycosyltransferase family 9 protein [Arthrobacter mobilis]NKX54138.1 glycosyltransferase family 9 protein [Arthrobacter mobilis]